MSSVKTLPGLSHRTQSKEEDVAPSFSVVVLSASSSGKESDSVEIATSDRLEEVSKVVEGIRGFASLISDQAHISSLPGSKLSFRVGNVKVLVIKKSSTTI